MKSGVLKLFAGLGLVVLLVGCTLDPNPAEVNFGEVLVGDMALGSAAFVNHNNKVNADVGGYSVNAPFAVTGTAQVINSGATGSPVSATFAPTTGGAFEDEVRPGIVNLMQIRPTPLKLKGMGVWAKNEGAFVLGNQPPNIVGSLDFSTAPIQPNQPIDWGTRRLGGPAIVADFEIRNTGAVAINGTANVRLIRNDQHFTLTFPSVLTGMNIAVVGPSALGTRHLQVTFTPDTLGNWSDIVEVSDTANPANRARIWLKAKVTKTGE